MSNEVPAFIAGGMLTIVVLSAALFSVAPDIEFSVDHETAALAKRGKLTTADICTAHLMNPLIFKRT